MCRWKSLPNDILGIDPERGEKSYPHHPHSNERKKEKEAHRSSDWAKFQQREMNKEERAEHRLLPGGQPAGWDSIAKFLKWLHSIAVSNHHGSPPQKPLHYTSRYFDLKTSFEEFHDPTRSNRSQAEEGLADLQDWLTFSPIPALTTSASAHLRQLGAHHHFCGSWLPAPRHTTRHFSPWDGVFTLVQSLLSLPQIFGIHIYFKNPYSLRF